MTTAPLLLGAAAEPPGALTSLLAAQDQVAARWQLTAEERTLAARQVAAGRWRRLGRCVVSHNGPLTERQLRWIAVLDAGPNAALAGATAAELGGLRGWRADTVHVLVPHRVRPSALDGVTPHLTRVDIGTVAHPVLSPRRVRLPAAVVQMASWATSDRAACGVLAAAVQQKLARATDLRSALLRQPRVPRRRLLALTLGDIEGGAQALSEIDAVRLCRRHGLPAPTRQAIRRDRHGRRRYLDLWWEAWRLAAEIDGMQHIEVVQWTHDMERHNELVIPGHTTLLRFAALTVRTEDAIFADQVGRALRARGWRP